MFTNHEALMTDETSREQQMTETFALLARNVDRGCARHTFMSD